MKIQLTLTVDYSPNGATSELLALTLEQAAEHLADNGLLSGNTGADVVSACHQVVEIDPRGATETEFWIQEQPTDNGRFFDSMALGSTSVEGASAAFSSWIKNFPGRASRLVVKTTTVLR